MAAVKPVESVDKRLLVESLAPIIEAPGDTPKQLTAKQKQQRDALAALVEKAEQVRAGDATFSPAEVQTLLASLILVVR